MSILFSDKLDKIKLLPLTKEHVSDLEKSCAGEENKSTWQYLFDSEIYYREGMATLVNGILSDKKKTLPFAILSTNDNLIIGIIRCVDIDPISQSLEIYTWIGARFQFKRFGVLAKYLLLRHLFEDKQFNRIQFSVDSKNDISKKSIEGIGAKLEGTLREHKLRKVPNHSYMRSSLIYSILRPEWPSIKKRMEEKLS